MKKRLFLASLGIAAALAAIGHANAQVAGSTTVGELARPFPVTLPAIGKHLTVLERARLVERWRDGRVRRVRLLPSAMRGAAVWLDDYRQLWDHQLDRLAAYLEEPPARPVAARRRKKRRPDAR